MDKLTDRQTSVVVVAGTSDACTLHTLDEQTEALPGQHLEGCRQEVWPMTADARTDVE